MPMNHPKHTCSVGDKDVRACVYVCVRASVSFSGFPGKDEITQAREEESQLMLFFLSGWLSFGEESSRILLCKKIVKPLSVNTCISFFLNLQTIPSAMSVKPDSAV